MVYDTVKLGSFHFNKMENLKQTFWITTQEVVNEN
jgi:hypothetical protein